MLPPLRGSVVYWKRKLRAYARSYLLPQLRCYELIRSAEANSAGAGGHYIKTHRPVRGRADVLGRRSLGPVLLFPMLLTRRGYIRRGTSV